ncbi:MAG: hypothetical protein AAFY33_15455 [Cyanobacteria bacterium J06643_4]
MDSSSFDLANASHWLLVGAFIVVSAVGLTISWQWFQEAKGRRRRLRLSRRLMMELHGGALPVCTADGQRHDDNSLSTTDRAACSNNRNSPNPIRFDN